MIRLDGKTPDLAAENIEQLWQIFQDAFEEGKSTSTSSSGCRRSVCGRRKGALQLPWDSKGQILNLAHRLLLLL